MNTYRKWMITGIGIMVVLLIAATYRYYFLEPDPFPNSEYLIEEMNSLYPEAAASDIQDKIFADERHVLVPFISKNNAHGLSYWVWKRNRWEVSTIHSKGTPMVWKVDPSNPSSFRFVWNIHPDDHVHNIDFFLIRSRDFLVTDGLEYYKPGIQMVENASMKEKPYGMLQLPKTWVTVMNSIVKAEPQNQRNGLFSSVFPEQEMSFGWLPYDQSNNDTFPERSVNGNSYSVGEEVVDNILILDKNDIEKPK